MGASPTSSSSKKHISFIDQVIESDESSLLDYDALHSHSHYRLPISRFNRASLPSRSSIPSSYQRIQSSKKTLSMPPNAMSAPVPLQERHPNTRSVRKPPPKTPKKQKQVLTYIESNNATAPTLVAATGGVNISNLTDFFNPEVFHMVLHNPTTAHRFLRYCQSRACGENIEFLQKVSLSGLTRCWVAPTAQTKLQICKG